MQNICVLCKGPIEIENKEHIIPEALLGNISKTQNVLISKDVCEACNNQSGNTVDAEFLNSDVIKALRLLHKDFLNKDKNPKIKMSNIITVPIDGKDVSFDIFIDKEGKKCKPSPKPIKEGNVTNYFISEDAVEEFIEKMNSKDKTLEVSRSHYKFCAIPEYDLSKFFELKFKNRDSNVPFSRLLFKMIIEYIGYKFGANIVLHEKFDPYRELARKKRDYHETKYKLIFFDRFPYDVDQLNCVNHRIGIRYDDEINTWIFFFSLYEFWEYNFILPFDKCYSDVTDIIKIRK